MADAGGYWLNLAEAQKLTQETLVPGIIEENLRRGGLLSLLPLQQVPGKSIKWNREATERSGRRANRGSTLTWTDNITYDVEERELKTIYDQTPLDNFVQQVYSTINNYEAITLLGMRKGMIKTIEDAIIYDDEDFNSDQFRGLHSWAQDAAASGPLPTDSSLSIDEGEGALAISNLRVLEDSMKRGIDFWLMPPEIVRRISAFYQEGFENSGSTNTLNKMGSLIFGQSEIGMRVPFFNGVPIITTDYLVAEQANTGVGSDARAKNTSGTNMFSIFAIKMGQVAENAPGLTLGFGGSENALGEMMKFDRFDKLEDFDAAGLRLVSYITLLAGSYKSVGRIFDITDAVVTA